MSIGRTIGGSIPGEGLAYRLAATTLLASAGVNPTEAIADLTEISSQVEAAALLDEDGTVLASTLPAEAANGLADAARAILAGAERVRRGGAAVTGVRASTSAGSVFVVRDGERSIVATTQPSPTTGLVLYDLRTCLRALAGAGEDSGAT